MRSNKVWMFAVVLAVSTACNSPATPAAAPVALSSPTFASPAAVPAALSSPTAPAPTTMPATLTPPAAAPTPPPGPTALPPAESADSDLVAGAFVSQEVPAFGSYTLNPASGVLRFSDDFKVSTGPDLVVALSGASDLTVDYVTFSRAVVSAPYLELGLLASPTGAQEYAVPPGTGLAVYNTVVVWCRRFDVAFAAAPLRP